MENDTVKIVLGKRAKDLYIRRQDIIDMIEEYKENCKYIQSYEYVVNLMWNSTKVNDIITSNLNNVLLILTDNCQAFFDETYRLIYKLDDLYKEIVDNDKSDNTTVVDNVKLEKFLQYEENGEFYFSNNVWNKYFNNQLTGQDSTNDNILTEKEWVIYNCLTDRLDTENTFYDLVNVDYTNVEDNLNEVKNSIYSLLQPLIKVYDYLNEVENVEEIVSYEKLKIEDLKIDNEIILNDIKLKEQEINELCNPNIESDDNETNTETPDNESDDNETNTETPDNNSGKSANEIINKYGLNYASMKSKTQKLYEYVRKSLYSIKEKFPDLLSDFEMETFEDLNID